MTHLTTVQYEIEVADDSATLYLTGSLAAADAPALRHACLHLPLRVATLRIDLHGVRTLGEDGMLAVRSVLRFWRESRGGHCRVSLASEMIVATFSEGWPAERPRATPLDSQRVTALAPPAQTASFL